MTPSKLKQFFERHFSAPAENNKNIDHELRLACAALMLEIIRVDEVIHEKEEAALLSLLKEKFDLSKAETDELTDIARDKMHNATDYFQFTTLLNEHYTQDQKVQLVLHLWELALADNFIDKYEEHLIRNLAELLHVSHGDFIRMKLLAQQAID